MNVCEYMCVQYLWRPDASDPLGMELQAFVSHPTCLLGMKLRSSGRAVHALAHWADLVQPITITSSDVKNAHMGAGERVQ